MNIWNKIWEHDTYSAPQLRKLKAKYKVDMFEPYVEIGSCSVCVDVGCGGGYISKELYDRFKCVLFSCDNASSAIKLSKLNNSFENSNFFVSSIENINLPNSIADVVICIGVLEHVVNIDQALKEIKRILKKTGKLVIVSSNCYSFVFLDKVTKQFFHKWKYGYQKNWSPSKLRKKLIETGFSINNISIYQGIGDFIILTKIDKAIAKLIPNWGRYIQIIGERND